MQRFEHQVTCESIVISISEAVTMVSLMDELAVRFCNMAKEVQDRPENTEVVKEYVKLGNQLNILERIGFCTSVPGMIQYNPEYFSV